MLLLVGAKGAMFPDGTPFEGVGIKPDMEVAPTIQDLATGGMLYSKQRERR
jgi:hypothetical protein